MAKQLGFYFNGSACSGCKACQLACQDKNNLPASMLWRRVVFYGGGGWVPQDGFMVPSGMFVYSISSACYHCEQAPCMQACPAGAISKRADGIVLINQDQCIGCRYCQWACPYGAPSFDQARGVMTKCTACADLVDQGQNPVCVDACPMRALEFGDIEELRKKYGDLKAVEPLPDPNITEPAFVMTPHKHAQFLGHGTGRILNMKEEL